MKSLFGAEICVAEIRQALKISPFDTTLTKIFTNKTSSNLFHSSFNRGERKKGQKNEKLFDYFVNFAICFG